MIAMPIPPYQELLQPILKTLSSDGEEMSKLRLVEVLATELQLKDEDVHAKLPSGTGTLLEHNIDWARSHLQMQGLLEGSLERGLRLTTKGWDYARQYYPDIVRQRFVASLPGTSSPTQCKDKLNAATRLLGLAGASEAAVSSETATLQQLGRLNDELGLALIERVCRQSPSFFETLVIDLLLAIGYGRGRRDLAQRLGRTGDAGVDGVVAMDELGLDLVYLQAKRYRPEIPVPVAAVRDFVGSLDAKRATRGVFFTTSFFPASAHDYVSQSTFRVVLVDGRRLAKLMMDHNIGVRVKDEIKIRRIDESYFEA
jgi:restriction system protein